MKSPPNSLRARPAASSPLLQGLRLDPGSSLPLHAQAEQSLRNLLARPTQTPGTLLPDEVSLANAMGVSRNTLRAAIARLVSEGRLNRKAGVGTRVVEPRVHSGVGAWQSFTREMESKGVKVETYSVSARMVAAPADAASRLHLKAGAEVLSLDRVRGWDGRPVVRFLSYLHPRLGLAGDDNYNQPLYELIRNRSGGIADQSDEELTAVAADGRLARVLAVKAGTPLLRRTRTVFDTRQQPMEYSIVHYRGDHFELSLTLRQH
ncbi:MAG: GntR family transcriptional regulator [Lacunisphaera sp.]|nr:GntR family transcriptional regulator [Lacunisphaera sp.]